MRPLAVVLVFLAAAAGWADGPLRVRNHRAASLLFLRMEPMGPLLAAGSHEVSASLAIANDFRVGDGFVEDYETQRLEVNGRTTAEDGTEWWIGVPVMARNGGVMDGLIDWWHAAVLGWSDPARNSAPMGRTRIAGTGIGAPGSSFGLGDTTVGLGRSIGRKVWARVAVKIPVGSSGRRLGSGAVDFGASLESEASTGRLTAWFQMAGVHQGPPVGLPDARRWAVQAGLALQYRLDGQTQLIVQWNHEDSPFRTGKHKLDSAHRLATFGVRHKLNRSDCLELYISEDGDLFDDRLPEVANIGPDVTLGVRWLKRF